jgi:ATP-dependent protease HslVU (ClpYQ) peptidase subunit
MTCIAGIARNGKVWMGADSFHQAGDVIYSSGSKIFRRGEFIIGACGDSRYGQLLAYALEFEPPKEDADMCRYMATDFANAIRKVAKDYGFIKQDEGQDHTGCRVLIGVRGCLFNLDAILSHVCIDSGFMAIGSGAVAALGSLYESQDSDKEPQERIKRALLAAEALTEYVRRPFTYDSI